MNQALSREQLRSILDSADIEAVSLDEITQFFLNETTIAEFAPDGICQIDPRNGDRIIYNSTRAKRPHDNRPETNNPASTDNGKPCLICEGKTTRVVDVADLSEGFTFINKNLFPIFYPANGISTATIDDSFSPEDTSDLAVTGYHFLQWTSSKHDKDWHNMPLDDRVIVMKRLAAMEKKVIEGKERFVSIIKNYGRLVGGSLVHGHQQIGVSNIMPNRMRQNKAFADKFNETFSAYILRENPQALMIKEYGKAALVTPYFMRRPYDMFLILKDTNKPYLHMLNDDEFKAIADGWRDSIRIILDIMPKIGRETAYTITTHNGPGAGLYFEFLPYTQEMGGFEHLGLYLCQGNPKAAATLARETLSKYPDQQMAANNN